ncbi:MAG: hypothetical protein WC348_01805 [Patescibacteria group bacterium]|jgi:uncharacterized coiled-coil protein SlyX
MKKLLIILTIVAILPKVALAKDTWYSTEEQNRINQQFSEMQAQVTELQQLNTQLQNKVDQISSSASASTPAPVPAQTIVETKEVIVRDPDNTKVEALEKRVTTLESVVSLIQTKIMQAINTAIGLLKKLLAR